MSALNDDKKVIDWFQHLFYEPAILLKKDDTYLLIEAMCEYDKEMGSYQYFTAKKFQARDIPDNVWKNTVEDIDPRGYVVLAVK